MKPLVPLLFLLFSAVDLLAETPEEKGLAIAVETDRRDIGFADTTADLLMILKNKQGQESRREVRVQTLEVPGDGDKSLSTFDTPRDIKGTALLSFSHKVGTDDQWFYLPALKRVKRISSADKSGSFMGSEFAYEDIGSQEVEKYTYRFLRDEVYEGVPCFVVEQRPVDATSGYRRQVVWIDTSEYRIRKVDYYDRKDSLLKTLVFTDYQRYLNQFWRAGGLSMVNHQTGKSTSLQWRNWKFRTGLTEADLNQEALKRTR